eukprot:scaffold35211_cov68-Phaeocystis_antarctica.AAC.6
MAHLLHGENRPLFFSEASARASTVPGRPIRTCRRRGHYWPSLTDRARLHAAGCTHGLHWRRAVLSPALSLSNKAGRPA